MDEYMKFQIYNSHHQAFSYWVGLATYIKRHHNIFSKTKFTHRPLNSRDLSMVLPTTVFGRPLSL